MNRFLMKKYNRAKNMKNTVMKETNNPPKNQGVHSLKWYSFPCTSIDMSSNTMNITKLIPTSFILIPLSSSSNFCNSVLLESNTSFSSSFSSAILISSSPSTDPFDDLLDGLGFLFLSGDDSMSLFLNSPLSILICNWQSLYFSMKRQVMKVKRRMMRMSLASQGMRRLQITPMVVPTATQGSNTYTRLQSTTGLSSLG